MNASTISYLIAYTGLYSAFLPVVVAIIRYRYLSGPTLIFAWLQVTACVIVVLSTWIFTTKNSYLSFIDTGIDALAMSLMYSSLMPNRWLKWLVYWFGPVFVVGLLVDYFFWEGPKELGDTIAAGLESLGVTLILIVYLRQLLEDSGIVSLRRYPMFLISVGLLAVSIVVAPVYFFVRPLMSYSMTLAMRAYDLMFTISFLSHILYSVGFWLTKNNSANDSTGSAM
jgi:hypothetical protein